jgi:hydrogenase maturation factor HypF (carbamoyltransferase family)
MQCNLKLILENFTNKNSENKISMPQRKKLQKLIKLGKSSKREDSDENAESLVEIRQRVCQDYWKLFEERYNQLLTSSIEKLIDALKKNVKLTNQDH